MKDIKAILAAGLLMAVGPMAAQATIVTGYFEGYTTSSNFYADNTAVRVDFTYDTDAAPSPYCDSIPGHFDTCDYYDVNGPDWLTSTLTIGSDTYEFGIFGDQYREVFVRDSLSTDMFYTSQTDHLFDFDGSTETYAHNDYFAVFFSSVMDFINGTALPTSVDISSDGEYLDSYGEGGWTSYGYVCDYDTNDCEEYDVYAGFLFDRLVIGADVPEPTSLALLGLGLVGIGLRRRKVV